MRLYPTTFLVFLCSSASLATADPSVDIQLASKHNIYLATCTPRRSCLLLICDNPEPFTAAAYYASGVSESSANAPTALTKVTDPAAAWEGTTRQANFPTARFSSSINAGAKGLAKGEIAGEAKVGTEGYTCFRDGESKFTWVGWDDLTIKSASCVADYWCASTS